MSSVKNQSELSVMTEDEASVLSRESSSSEIGEASLGAIRIPETRDGFFGYSEEKSSQQVCQCNSLNVN